MFHCEDQAVGLECFHRTMADGWAYARHYQSETERRAALAGWLHEYNHHRPHSATEGKPPISRLTNLSDQYIWTGLFGGISGPWVSRCACLLGGPRLLAGRSWLARCWVRFRAVESPVSKRSGALGKSSVEQRIAATLGRRQASEPAAQLDLVRLDGGKVRVEYGQATMSEHPMVSVSTPADLRTAHRPPASARTSPQLRQPS